MLALVMQQYSRIWTFSPQSSVKWRYILVHKISIWYVQYREEGNESVKYAHIGAPCSSLSWIYLSLALVGVN